MSSSPLPVPSKAALTALRGLIVGASCTLALVAEDRRRRINNALRVIDNGEKIKSVRNYRAGGTAFAVALEEEVLFDGALFGPLPEDSSKRRPHGLLLDQFAASASSKRNTACASAPLRKETPSSELSSTRSGGSGASRAGRSSSGLAKQAAGKPNSFIQPLAETHYAPNRMLAGPRWPPIDPEILKSCVLASNEEVVLMVNEACQSREPRKIAGAVQATLDTFRNNGAPDNQHKLWIGATALLCRTCQELGRIDDAANILHQVLCRGPLEEASYFAHGPLAVIESLLAAQPETGSSAGAAESDNLDRATKLFLVIFKEKPEGSKPEVFHTGRRLLEALFSANQLQNVHKVFRRCLLNVEGEPCDFTASFIVRLQEKEEHRAAIRIFLRHYSEQSPNSESIASIGDAVVRCVESAHNFKAADVLKTLWHLISGVCKLRTEWAIKLLSADFMSHRKFEKTKAVFDELMISGLAGAVIHQDGLCRIMVELALEADELWMAESYLREATIYKRQVDTDPRMLGLFARYRAKLGEWDEVRKLFETMKADSPPAAKAYGEVFVPILKAYAKEHTVRETEAFTKSYIDELHVPLCPFIVTLMAKQYASIRDFSSLIEWLEYCSLAGFKVDAAFTNAILVNCRHQSNLPFRDLRTLFRKLRALNPDFVDSHTERVMTTAALADSKYGPKLARGRVLSLRIDPNLHPAKGKCAQEDDVILAMKEALTAGRPGRAIWIYKRALRVGMPSSQHALQLAVQAEMKMSHGRRGDRVYDLLQQAQESGQDVNHITNHVIALRLKEMDANAGRAEVLDTVRSTLKLFESRGITLADVSLNRAAHVCLAAGHLEAAISYAQSAVEARGSSRECYNIHNFRILLSAYVEMVDVDGIRGAIANMLCSGYREETGCLKTLKNARARVLRARLTRVSDEQRREAHAVIQDGIRDIVEARKQLRAKGRVMESEALRIMKRAALDAGCEAVDFDSIPWLGGKGEQTQPLLDEALDISECCGKDDAVEPVRPPTAVGGTA